MPRPMTSVDRGGSARVTVAVAVSVILAVWGKLAPLAGDVRATLGGVF